MLKINLTQEAYICGGEYRLRENSIYVMNEWYEAHGIDDDGAEYNIVWKIKDGIDINELQDESEACEWNEPIEIKDDYGNYLDDGTEVILVDEGGHTVLATVICDI